MRANRVCHRYGVALPPTVSWLFARQGRGYFSRSGPRGEFKADFLSPFCAIKAKSKIFLIYSERLAGNSVFLQVVRWIIWRLDLKWSC